MLMIGSVLDVSPRRQHFPVSHDRSRWYRSYIWVCDLYLVSADFLCLSIADIGLSQSKVQPGYQIQVKLPPLNLRLMRIHGTCKVL
jgi:hypothetical protein